MTEEAELVEAVVAAPDDDGPRLVYADWLQQRGDPRGELIAVQCRLAAGDPDEPDPAVHAREQELLADDAYAVPLRAIASGTFERRRGFVEHVHTLEPLDDARLTQLRANAPLLRSASLRGMLLQQPLPEAWRELTALTLTEACYLVPEALAAFAAAPQIANLRRLHFVDASFHLDGALALLSLAQPLEHFGLVFTRWSSDVGDHTQIPKRLAFTGWPLRSLALGGFDILDPSWLAAFPQLTALALQDSKTSITDVLMLAPKLPALTTLELDYNNDVRLEPGDLAALVAAFPALRRLRVRGARIGARHVKALVKAPEAARLRRLDLSQNRLDDAAARLVVDLLPSLRRFDAAGHPLGDAIATRLHEHRRANPVVDPVIPSYPPAIVDYLVKNQKIAAIKEYRGITDCGLLEAKLAIERFADELGLLQRPLPRTTWLRA